MAYTFNRIMPKRERLFILVFLASSACGGRTDNPAPTTSAGGLSAIGGAAETGGWQGTGGLSSIGGTTALGGSPSIGGSTSTGTSACPSGIPQAGDPCQNPGLYCNYDNFLCLTAYQCSATGKFEWVGNCPSIMGGASSTGGATAAGADSISTGGATPAGGNPSTGGTTSAGGVDGSGCTGNFEEIQTTSGLCVAKMVTIEGPASDAGNANYQIDVTEVTQGQYDAWLATNPALPASTDTNCGYVTSYAEQSSSGAVYTGSDADHHPVVFVDWCDAYEYCLGVDKRLCGAIGGGSVDFSASYNDTWRSQWYRACSSAGPNTYPYGNTYQPSFCDGQDYWNGNYSTMRTVAVGSLTDCVTSATGYAGVYDLSGNVSEWEDSCDATGPLGNCHLRGGAFNEGGSALACGVGARYDARAYVSDDGYQIGFRCCSP